MNFFDFYRPILHKFNFPALTGNRHFYHDTLRPNLASTHGLLDLEPPVFASRVFEHRRPRRRIKPQAQRSRADPPAKTGYGRCVRRLLTAAAVLFAKFSCGNLSPAGTGVQVGSDIALPLKATPPGVGNIKYKVEVAPFDGENVGNT